MQPPVSEELQEVSRRIHWIYGRIFDVPVSTRAKLLYCYLCVWSQQGAQPGDLQRTPVQVHAHKLGMTERQINQAAEELEEAGLLRRQGAITLIVEPLTGEWLGESGERQKG